jgi:excisionase family DNA binding protein
MSKIQFEDLPEAVGELLEKVCSIEHRLAEVVPPGAAPDNALLTINEASEYLNLSRHTVYKLVQGRLIPFSKKGKRLIFIKQELLAWVKEGRQMTARERLLETEARMLKANKTRR